MRFFRIPFNPDDESGSAEARPNRLQKYIHAQSAQDMSRLASEIGPEVRQIIGANVQALLGYLPNNDFTTTVVASKENLQNLLASAMLTGYFMHAMEVRLQMDELFAGDSEAAPKAESPDQPDELLQRPESLFRLGTDPIASPEVLTPLPEAGIPEPIIRTYPLESADKGRFLDSSEFGTAQDAPETPQSGDEQSLLAGSETFAHDITQERDITHNTAQEIVNDISHDSTEPDLGAELGADLRFEALDAPFHQQPRSEPDESPRISGRISGRISDKFNIQLEINTHMNQAELARLLQDLREFRRSDDEPDIGTY